MTRVFNGERTFLSPVLRPIEIGLYRIAGIDESREQHWITYTIAMLFFHVAGFLFLYALLRFQEFLPLNPQGMTAVAPDLAFNTSVSFIVTGGNMEGKEVRFGIHPVGVVRRGHDRGLLRRCQRHASDSFTALGGMIPLINIQLGEIVMAASAPACTACCIRQSWRSLLQA